MSFAPPPCQEGLSATLTAGGTTALTNRGVPDVAGDADENTGYDVSVDGKRYCYRRNQCGRAAMGRTDRANQLEQ